MRQKFRMSTSWRH